LSNFMQVGEPNTPSCFRKHWECQSQIIASRGKDWTISCLPFVRSAQIIFVIIGQMLSITNIILHLPLQSLTCASSTIISPRHQLLVAVQMGIEVRGYCFLIGYYLYSYLN
jgi:hypothetical protein